MAIADSLCCRASIAVVPGAGSRCYWGGLLFAALVLRSTKDRLADPSWVCDTTLVVGRGQLREDCGVEGITTVAWVTERDLASESRGITQGTGYPLIHLFLEE